MIAWIWKTKVWSCSNSWIYNQTNSVFIFFLKDKYMRTQDKFCSQSWNEKTMSSLCLVAEFSIELDTNLWTETLTGEVFAKMMTVNSGWWTHQRWQTSTSCGSAISCLVPGVKMLSYYWVWKTDPKSNVVYSIWDCLLPFWFSPIFKLKRHMHI